MRLVEELSAWGHQNVLGMHGMTFEITRDHDLSRRGDCVIGVSASKGPKDLSFDFRRACGRGDARISVRLEALRLVDVIHGSGSEHLDFGHPTEMVGRKSSFTSGRTIMVKADKAACDIDRRLIEALKSTMTKLNVRLTVEI